MNAPFMLTYNVQTTSSNIMSEGTSFTGEISTPPSNAGNVIFRGVDGSPVIWVPGEYHSFIDIDLAKTFCEGTPGDTLTLNGSVL